MPAAELEFPINGTKDTHCYVCGPDNPGGLNVPYYPDGSMAAVAIYIARPEHRGWTGILHGGVLFSLMDEAFGWSLFFENIPVVTAKIETRFHKPVAIGTPLHIRAWVTGQRRSLYDARAEVRIDHPQGELVAEAEAVLCPIANSKTGE